ncbi:MAG: TonB-dependent receptor plug domain-containing protein [Woeseia sp.]
MSRIPGQPPSYLDSADSVAGLAIATLVLILHAAVAGEGAAAAVSELEPGTSQTAQGLDGDQDRSPDGSSTVVYDQIYFRRYNVTTVSDMLRRVPGIGSIVDSVINPVNNQPAVRGFGSSGDQILINNKRIAGKANEISATLERIQATQVSRIELIRGTSAEVDVRSEGTIVNIIIDTSGETQGEGSWQISSRISDSGKSMPGGNLSYGGRHGRLQYLTSLTSKPEFELQTRDEQFLSPIGELTEQRFETEKKPQERPYTATGNLIYQFKNGDELRLNGLVSIADRLNEEITDRLPVDTSGVPAFLMTELRSDRTEILTSEIGADYGKRLGETGVFQTLLIYSLEEKTAEEDLRSITTDTVTVENLELADTVDTEAIVRIAYSWDITDKQNLEIGAEAAANSLDTDLQIFEDRNGELVALDFFNPDSVVEELRYELFATDRWKLGDRTSLELALNAEFSRLTQRGSEIDNDRSFSFLKPRLDFRFDMTPNSQLRLKAERTVRQLNFADFVAAFDFQDDEVDFGNPTLSPENAWEYEIRYEHRLANDNGVVEVRGFLNDIDDHIDKGPIDIDGDGLADTDDAGLLRSARANIGEARLYGAEFKSSLRMSWIGLPDAIINAGLLLQESETTDPFTGEKREMFRTRGTNWSVGFRHDVSRTGLSYGLDLNRLVGVSRTDDVRDRWRFEDDIKMTAFLETRILGSMTLRFDGQRLLEDQAWRTRTLYVSNVADGALKRLETFDRVSDRLYTVSLRGTF